MGGYKIILPIFNGENMISLMVIVAPLFIIAFTLTLISYQLKVIVDLLKNSIEVIAISVAKRVDTNLEQTAIKEIIKERADEAISRNLTDNGQSPKG